MTFVVDTTLAWVIPDGAPPWAAPVRYKEHFVKQFDMHQPAAEPRRRSKRRRGRDTIGLHRLPTCSATGKVRYRDHAQASDGLQSAKEARGRDERVGITSRRREARSYKCSGCGGWHNTSIVQWIDVPRGEPAVAAAKSINDRVAA